MRRHEVERADGVLGRVGLVGVDGEVSVRPELSADRGHPLHILVDMAVNLDLEMPNALVGEGARVLGHVRRRFYRQDAQRREFAHRRAAEQVADRHAETAREQVMQGAIDAGFRLIVSHHGVIEIVQNTGDLARVATDQRLAEPVERTLHGLMRRAIVIHRRGVAVADGAVFGADADDPALRCRVCGQRKFPVLVQLREDRTPRPAPRRSSFAFSLISVAPPHMARLTRPRSPPNGVAARAAPRVPCAAAIRPGSPENRSHS